MDEFTETRLRLQTALTEAALALFEHTGSAALCAPIPGTTPSLFIAIGEAAAIAELVADRVDADDQH
jgi:hypothetical protein